jgi:hypothetical protein
MSGFTRSGYGVAAEPCTGVYLLNHVCNNDTRLEGDDIYSNTWFDNTDWGTRCYSTMLWTWGCD